MIAGLLDPCGMVMDVLRSAHKVSATVSADGLTKTKIRWYKAKPGAKAFPGFHSFGSAVWEPHPDEWTQGPGVESFPLEWAPKDIPAPPGREFHGRQEWYERGIPRDVLDNPEPWLTPPCRPDPIRFGVRVGMSVSRRDTLAICPNCETPSDIARMIRLRFFNLTGDFLNTAGYVLPSELVFTLEPTINNRLISQQFAGPFRFNIQVACGSDPLLPISFVITTWANGPYTAFMNAVRSVDWPSGPLGNITTAQNVWKRYPCGSVDLSENEGIGTFNYLTANGVSSYSLSIESV